MRRRYKARFYDYRALAEGLRVQMYWTAAGITACAGDHYLRRQRSELDWIRQALRVWTLTARMAGTGWVKGVRSIFSAISFSASPELPRENGSDPFYPARRQRLEEVLEQWVDGQWDYYSRAARRRQAMGTRLNRVAMGCFLLGLLLAGSQPYFQGNPAFKVAFGLAPAAAALFYLYAHTRAFLEQARQYDRMSQLFGNARGRLRRVLEEGDFEKFQHLLFDLGKEALRRMAIGSSCTASGRWTSAGPARGFRPDRGFSTPVFVGGARAENVLTLINSTQRNDPMAEPQSLQTGVEKKLVKQGPRKLLALDSGGIRGLMTIEILAEIERTLRRLYGGGESFVLADYFDYIGGTSIGAITAMGLSLGMSVERDPRSSTWTPLPPCSRKRTGGCDGEISTAANGCGR